MTISAQSWLSQLTVAHLCEHVGKSRSTDAPPLSTLVCAHVDSTVAVALHLMLEYRLSALPVYRVVTVKGEVVGQSEPWTERQEFVKILTAFDLMHHVAFQPRFYLSEFVHGGVLEGSGEQEPKEKKEEDRPEQLEQEQSEQEQQVQQPEHSQQVQHIHGIDIAHIKERIERAGSSDFLQHQLHAVDNVIPPSDPLVVFHGTDSLASLFQAFAEHGLHRALVLDPSTPGSASAATIVTQTDLLAFVYDSRAHFAAWLTETRLRSLIRGKSMVVVVHSTVPVVTAFKKMAVHGVNALAVIDEEGRLVAALKASHVKHVLDARKIELLEMPILDFLEAIDDPELDPLRSHEDTVMEHVLERMFREKAHRVWIVDEANDKPRQVITMSDVLRSLLEVQ